MIPGQRTTHQPLNGQKGSCTALPDRFIRQPAGPGGRGSLGDDPAGHKLVNIAICLALFASAKTSGMEET